MVAVRILVGGFRGVIAPVVAAVVIPVAVAAVVLAVVVIAADVVAAFARAIRSLTPLRVALVAVLSLVGEQWLAPVVFAVLTVAVLLRALLAMPVATFGLFCWVRGHVVLST